MDTAETGETAATGIAAEGEAVADTSQEVEMLVPVYQLAAEAVVMAVMAAMGIILAEVEAADTDYPGKAEMPQVRKQKNLVTAVLLPAGLVMPEHIPMSEKAVTG